MGAIPNGEIRKVEHQGVFFVTVGFALFAYSWLVFIVQLNSPDVVTIGEGLFTIAFYPVLLFTAYRAHIRQQSKEQPSMPTKMPLARPLTKEVGDPNCIRNAMGDPIDNPHGVITFEDDVMDVTVGRFQLTTYAKLFRKNGTSGTVTCRYRTEGRTAVAGKDFVADEGHISFADGVAETEIPITLLPKDLGEASDQLQLIIDDVSGGACFNPNTDGRDDSCVLTLDIYNENDDMVNQSHLMRIRNIVDKLMNEDQIGMATETWVGNISATFKLETEDGVAPTGGDYVLFLIFFPWRFGFALVIPPPGYCGGWLSFFVCLCLIGFLSTCICDFSGLFGCVVEIEDYITAITFVAMGTSMPDLFVSKTAAVQEEYADGSIVTVTGGDSARVFLGIGIPWTLAAIYWSGKGATEDWKQKYPKYVTANPDGAFIVKGGMLGFNVLIYLLMATPCLVTIVVRRIAFGGELGGPFGPKVLTSIMFVLMWFFYLYMSVWKITAGVDASFGEAFDMIWHAASTVEHVAAILGAFVFFCCMKKKPPPQHDSDHEQCGHMFSTSSEAALLAHRHAADSALRAGATSTDSTSAPGWGGAQIHNTREFRDPDGHEMSPMVSPSRSPSNGLVSSIFVAMAANRFKVGLKRRHARYMQQSMNYPATQWQVGQPQGLPGSHVTPQVFGTPFSAQPHVERERLASDMKFA